MSTWINSFGRRLGMFIRRHWWQWGLAEVRLIDAEKALVAAVEEAQK